MKKILLSIIAMTSLSLSVMAAGAAYEAKSTGPASTNGVLLKNGEKRSTIIPLEKRVRTAESDGVPGIFRPRKIVPEFKNFVPVAAEGVRYPQIMGQVIYSSGWTASNALPGVFVLPTSAGEKFVNKIPLSRPAMGGGVRVGEHYYLIEYVRNDYGYTVYVNKYNTSNWKYEKYWTGTVANISPGGMAVDPTTGKVYGIFYTEDLSGCTLSTIDFTDDGPVMETISQIPNSLDVVAVSFDSAGQLYAITRTTETDINDYVVLESTLCKMDKKDGKLTKIGETGMYPYYTSAAVIDTDSNRMFWTVSPKDNTGHLCEVDLNTGAATLVYTFPDGEEINGLFIGDPLAADKAPDAPTGLQLSYPDGKLTGNVEFDVPSTTFDGAAASGDVDYSISYNGNEPIKGTTQYGAHVKVEVTVPAPNDYTFRVNLISEAGVSPTAEVSQFIGVGVPVAPKPRMTVENGVATITWPAVKEVVGKGFIDPDQITYTVTRVTDGTVVAKNVKETTVTDAFPEYEGLAELAYVVEAAMGDVVSQQGKTNSILLGNINVPYEFAFNTGEIPLGYVVYDVNRDEKTWMPYASDCVAAWYNKNQAMNDWLITPPVKLEAGVVYPLRFQASTGGFDCTENIEVKLGKTPTVQDMTISVLQPTAITSSTPEEHLGYIVVEETGLYYLGFHGISEPDQYMLKLYDYAIDKGTTAPVPMTPVVEAVADPDGKNSVTVSIKLPETDLTGRALESITKVVVIRDGKQNVRTIPAPAPGSTQSFNDRNVPEGAHTYTAVVYCGELTGAPGSCKAFVGNSIPAATTSASIVETANPGEVTISWEPVVNDIYGKPIKGEVKYNIYAFAENGSSEIIKENVAGPSVTFNILEDGGQEFVQCGVKAVSDKGEGEGAITNVIVVGEPYATPWREHFFIDNVGAIAMYDMEGDVLAGLTYDDYFNIPSQDGDEMYMAFMGDRDNMVMIGTGKIDLKGLQNPVMTVFVYTFGDDDDTVLDLYAGLVNDELTQLKSVALKDLGDRGWQLVTLDLKDYVGKTIQLGFKYTLGSYGIGLLDNLRVRDNVANDMMVSYIDSPLKATPARDYAVYVGVHNDGLQAVEAFNVDLYMDGKKYATLPGKALQPEADDLLTFTIQLSALATEPVEIWAEVVTSGDEIADNNSSESVVIKPIKSTLPPVTDLVGEVSESGNKLSWGDPDAEPLAPGVQTYDFEDEKSYAKSIEGWKFVDVDRQPAGAFSGFDLPGIVKNQTLTSFIVFDSSLPFLNDKFATHSGNKCLATMWRYDEKQTDDWLITPLLSGEAQEISFYARSYNENFAESFTILYSKTDTDINSFRELDFIASVPEAWTQYYAEVEEGVKYLAIRSSNSGGYMLFIDDFEFAPAPEHSEFSLTGYSVYADNEKLETTEDNEYFHNITSGVHSYAVTAVYDKGESSSSNVVVLESAGVDEVSGRHVVIVGVDGTLRVTGAEGCNISVAAVDGKVLYSGVGDELTIVTTGHGVFMVTVNGETAKVIVK